MTDSTDSSTDDSNHKRWWAAAGPIAVLVAFFVAWVVSERSTAKPADASTFQAIGFGLTLVAVGAFCAREVLTLMGSSLREPARYFATTAALLAALFYAYSELDGENGQLILIVVLFGIWLFIAALLKWPAAATHDDREPEAELGAMAQPQS